MYPQALWTMPPDSSKTLYMTFDDGPIPEMTPYILDLLQKHGAKATFFCVGDNVLKYPDIYRRIQADGHSVGNHTFHHLNGWKTPLSEYVENVHQCARYVQSRLFRPPYGCLTRKQMAALAPAYQIIMWDVLSGDFDPSVGPEQCLRHVTRHARPGSIIVLHDNIKAQKQVFYALPRLLDYFNEKGYRFCSIPVA